MFKEVSELPATQEGRLPTPCSSCSPTCHVPFLSLLSLCNKEEPEMINGEWKGLTSMECVDFKNSNLLFLPSMPTLVTNPAACFWACSEWHCGGCGRLLLRWILILFFFRKCLLLFSRFPKHLLNKWSVDLGKCFILLFLKIGVIEFFFIQVKCKPNINNCPFGFWIVM